MLRHTDRSATQILGEVDAMKFRSCLTLFVAVAPAHPVLNQALAAFYPGAADAETLRLLRAERGA